MSDLYYFIATRTTYEIAIPSRAAGQEEFNRKISGALAGLAGGIVQAGDLKVRTRATPSPANHLLCDGSVLNRTDFPQLADALGIEEGAAIFALPNFIGTTPAVAPTAPAQNVTSGGTVEIGAPDITEPVDPGEAGGSTGGNQISGGRVPRFFEVEDFR